jgi:thymidylate synthase ThyX
MTQQLNVEPTAEVIDQIAAGMQHAADELARIAARMRQYKDLSQASLAMEVLKNLPANLRTDLLVTRPLREYERALGRAEKAVLERDAYQTLIDRGFSTQTLEERIVQGGETAIQILVQDDRENGG